MSWRGERTKVSWANLGDAYEGIKIELDEAYHRVMESGRFILDAEVRSFERAFSDYCDVRHCVGVGNGLDALHLALRAFDIGQGDEVLVPSNTFVATWLAVTYSGAIPVPVEPDIRTYNMDPALLEGALSKRTRAIIPVDLYGQPADADLIGEVAREHDLVVIGDAAQSHGASFRGRKTGSFYDAECFSFYPIKNMGAAGDAGAVTTNNTEIDEKLRMLRNYGSKKKYEHQILGFNSRLDELQAAFLRIKLNHIDEWNKRRGELAKLYTRLIEEVLKDSSPVVLPFILQEAVSAWHLYVVRVSGRQRVQDRLRQQGIETLVHYPIPPHLQPSYADLGYTAGSLPVAELISKEILSIPLHESMSEEQVEYVAKALVKSLP